MGLLVLSRSEGQAVQVGDTCVTVEAIRGRRVRLSFAAPKEIRILRQELTGEMEPKTREGRLR